MCKCSMVIVIVTSMLILNVGVIMEGENDGDNDAVDRMMATTNEDGGNAGDGDA